MEHFSIWHWLVILIWLALLLPPTWMIVKKAGFPAWLSILALVPIVNVIALWAFAFARWPRSAIGAPSGPA